MKILSPVLRRTAPGQRSGDGDGNAVGTGLWRFRARLQTFRQPLAEALFGLSFGLRNGYNPTLRKAGWWFGGIEVGAAGFMVRVSMRWTDEELER